VEVAVVLVHVGHHVVEAVVTLVHAGHHVVAAILAVQGGDDGGYDNVVQVALAVDAPRHPCKPCCYAEKLLLYY